MASTKYKGTGVIADSDYKDVKWVGETKGGKAITILLKDAINMGNLSWTMADKGEIVPSIEFQATYSNTNGMPETKDERFEIEIEGAAITPGAEAIALGLGVFYVGENKVGLCRGGGSFNVNRTFREIAADGDRGAVKGRIVIDESRATLQMNVLEILSRLTDYYPAMTSETIA